MAFFSEEVAIVVYLVEESLEISAFCVSQVFRSSCSSAYMLIMIASFSDAAMVAVATAVDRCEALRMI